MHIRVSHLCLSGLLQLQSCTSVLLYSTPPPHPFSIFTMVHSEVSDCLCYAGFPIVKTNLTIYTCLHHLHYFPSQSQIAGFIFSNEINMLKVPHGVQFPRLQQEKRNALV